MAPDGSGGFEVKRPPDVLVRYSTFVYAIVLLEGMNALEPTAEYDTAEVPYVSTDCAPAGEVGNAKNPKTITAAALPIRGVVHVFMARLLHSR